MEHYKDVSLDNRAWKSSLKCESFRGSFRVACEKIWGSFGVVFRSILGMILGSEIMWGRGSFRVTYTTRLSSKLTADEQ